MQIKLTARYLLMVLISTLLLLGSALLVLTYLESRVHADDSTPTAYAYNFGSKIAFDANENLELPEETEVELIEKEAWVQILDNEGYVVDSYNAPEYLATHYTPLEIAHFPASKNYRDDYLYEFGRTSEGVSYLIAMPNDGWFSQTIVLSTMIVRNFFQMMLVITLLIFLVIGFIFSRTIAKPVSQIIGGVDTLATGDYEARVQEKGLYRKVLARLNQLATQLQSSETEREMTRKQRENWLSNISHDLKTPLATIKGYAEILTNPDYTIEPEEVETYSKAIHEKSLYMEEMIEELRLNEALMQNGVELATEEINFTIFVKEIVIEILNQPKFSNRKITFHAEQEELKMNVDQNLMKRSVENLIYNALMHNPEETEVKVQISQEAENISLVIEDDGQGLAPEEVDQLFNRYYRGSNTKNVKGTGLGLSIANEVVEAHGGEIAVASLLGEGTTVSVELPINI